MSAKIDNLQTEEAINKRKIGLKKYRDFIKNINELDIMKDYEGSGKRKIQAYLYKIVKDQEEPFSDTLILVEIVEQNIDKFLENMNFTDAIIHILYSITDIKPKNKKEKKKPINDIDTNEIKELLNIINKKLSIY